MSNRTIIHESSARRIFARAEFSCAKEYLSDGHAYVLSISSVRKHDFWLY